MTAGWVCIALWVSIAALIACAVAYVRERDAADAEWDAVHEHEQTMRALTPGGHR